MAADRTPNRTPNRDDVRRVLTAAADVLFSDGVPEEFLDQWADETLFLLSLGTPSVTPHRRG